MVLPHRWVTVIVEGLVINMNSLQIKLYSATKKVVKLMSEIPCVRHFPILTCWCKDPQMFFLFDVVWFFLSFFHVLDFAS